MNKLELTNEELLHIMEFCMENNLRIQLGVSPEVYVTLTAHDNDVHRRYYKAFSISEIRNADYNVAEVFLEKANKEFHPVAEDKWIEVSNYCDNDVIATEAATRVIGKELAQLK